MRLQAKNIQCQRGSMNLFEAISFDLHESQSILIAGPNGVGKTTFLESLAGIRGFASGELVFNGQSIAKGSDSWLQAAFYLGHKTGNKKELNCLENLSTFMLIQEQKQGDFEIETVLEEVGLGGFEYQLAGQLSAGQFKRLALARLLITEKPIWILDEPFVNLDVAGCEWLLQKLKAHTKQGGVLILTAHENREIQSVVDFQVCMEACE